jgi:antitoxin YefM
MKTTYSVTHAQANFPRLVREAPNVEAIAITRHDETVAYLVSCEQMEAIVETMEILANPKAMAQIRSHGKGKTKFHPLDALDHEG